MAVLALSIVFAYWYKFMGLKRRKMLIYTVVIISIIELIPAKIYMTQLDSLPHYYSYIQDLGDTQGFIDMVHSRAEIFYYQTMHEKKMAGGYLSRVPKSAVQEYKQIQKLASHYEMNYKPLLNDYHIKYIFIKNASDREIYPGQVFKNKEVVIINLEKMNTMQEP